jgi:hypothetical protein
MSIPIFNTQQRCLLERAIKACLEQSEQSLFRLLVRGPVGSGKLTAIKETAAALGLVVHQPCSLTVHMFEEEIARLALLHPALILVKAEDFARAMMVLERQNDRSVGLLILLTMQYSASQKVPTDDQFDLFISFPVCVAFVYVLLAFVIRIQTLPIENCFFKTDCLTCKLWMILLRRLSDSHLLI